MGMAAIAPMAWTPGYAVLMFFMWWIMMMAMGWPSATLMILLFALINRKQREHGAPYVPTGIFMAGYLLVWGAFSLRRGLRAGPERIKLLSSMLASTSVLLGAGLLIAAGFISSPCPSTPARAIVARRSLYRSLASGNMGALHMGVDHGVFLHRLLLVPEGRCCSTAA